MGLDMYLYLEKYESCCSWDKDYSQNKRDKFYPKEMSGLRDLIERNNFLSKTTKYQVAYWRKCNQIHEWIISHCAEDVDDCRPVYVSTEKATELLDVCKKVLENHTLATELLPTQSGFFFGSTDYDEWYYQDIEYTISQLEPILKFVQEQDQKRNHYYLVYEASW